MKHFPRILIILATISTLLPAYVSASNQDATSKENSSRVIAALVNDQPIYKDQLSIKHQVKIDKYKRFNRNQEPSEEVKTLMLKEVLKDFIHTELFLQASKNHHVENLKQKIADKIDAQKKHYEANPELKAKKINPITIERQIRINSYLQSHDLVNPQKPENELKEVFEKSKHQFASKADRAHVLHLITKDKKDIVKARQLILEGKPFLDVSKQYSIDKNSADLGFIEKNYMPQKVDKLVFSLKIGELSPIIETDQGYHLIKVLSKSPKGTIPTFAQIKDFLAKGYAPKIRAEKIKKHLKQLKENTNIKILLPELK